MVSENPTDRISTNLLNGTSMVFRENFYPLILLSIATILPSYIKELLLTLSSETMPNNWQGQLVDLILSAWELLPIIGIILITEGSRQNKSSLRFWQAIKLGAPLWKNAIIPQILLGLMTSRYLLSLLPYYSFMPDDRQTYEIFAALLPIIGYLIYSYTYFAVQAVALRGKSNLEALKHSFRLIKNQWWYAFWHMLGFGLPIILLGLIGSFIIDAFAFDSMSSQLSLAYLLGIFILPFGHIYLTLLFFKLEDRKRDYFGESLLESA